MSPKAKKYRKTFISIFDEINGYFIDRFSVEEWKQFQNLLGKLE